MSTCARDLASKLSLSAAAGSPGDNTTTITGTGVDLINADDQCVAVQHVGTVSGTTPTLDGKIQESADNSTAWTDITGATFTQVTTSTHVQAITFQRTKRYVRYVGTIAGTSPQFALDALIGESKKQV